MSIDLQALIDKLDPNCRKGVEAAAELCVAQTNYNVELEHLLLKLLEIPDTDIRQLLRHYEIGTATLNRELTLAIERFKRGNSRTPALSPYILQLLEQAWLLSSLHYQGEQILSGAIFQALLDNDTLRGVIVESAPSLTKIPREAVKKEFTDMVRAVERASRPDGTPPKKEAVTSPRKRPRASQTPALDQFTIDLIERARQGKIDPIYGRDTEIRQLIDILTRRRQNNPILTGEAGVGKTAVVEGFALRIAGGGDVPPALANISIRILDLALLQAGAGIRGEFEKRLKAVIDEVKRAPAPVILFIDEAHTMIGAGGMAGQGDAANLLKPVLARGELRTIAATTWSEYKKYFEKDPALVRRFQVVKVAEPDEASAVEMLRGVVANLEAHHRVTVLDEAVWDAVRLSNRYITGRQLPDKAISVLDTACARVAVGQNSTPPEIEDAVKRGQQLELEIAILGREQASGHDHSERLEELTRSLAAVHGEQEMLEKRWEEERAAVAAVLELQADLQRSAAADAAGLERLKSAKADLAGLQAETTMVPLCVDARVIARVISNWTGIPVGKMLTDEIDTVLNLKEKMAERIIGQPQALDMICRRIRTYRAGLDDPGKPVGVFLLAGPSGVGKTETALTLADLLYGGDRNLVVINMSEYQEAYTVSGLKGAPPGYVGHGKGGVLTEAVRQNPYSAVLLDEVEKAHPDVMELFYQVFDKGVLEDSEGVVVDFKNTVIMLTSNVGTDAILNACMEGEDTPDLEDLVEQVRPELLRYFKPAFLGRLVIVPYLPLNDSVIRRIVRLKLEKIQLRFAENHRVAFTYSDELVDAVADRCTEVDSGARNVDHLLTHTLLPELSSEMLRRMAAGQACTSIHGHLDDQGGLDYRFEPAFREEGLPEGESRTGGLAGRPLDRSGGDEDHPESIQTMLAEAKKRSGQSGRGPGKIDKTSRRWRKLIDRL
ncbi:MAG: type VI secretion system ATPase TssH [Desulfobacterales bacterium]|nr:type VI secretion system ATPase TssH [Desulfobacterales bacterium]